MKVLVDTSVWLAAFAKSTSKASGKPIEKLHTLIDSEQMIYLSGIILFEVVRGFKHVKERQQLVEQLSAFPMLDLERNDYLLAADLSAMCRNKGIITSTPDSLIAATAIRHDCHLFTMDKDFEQIAKAIPLKILGS